MVRMEATADDSLAEILERNRLGMAMAAMIRMIATTINNSIRLKPRCFLMTILNTAIGIPSGALWGSFGRKTSRIRQIRQDRHVGASTSAARESESCPW